MIRIHVGAICHYGVYCSDDEVIEFGDAPLDGLNRDASKIFVKSVSIDEFSAGKLVEVASLDRAERRSRFSPKKTMKIARERIGEGGYDILKNNCEHFANECVFGRHFCELEEAARKSWRARPVLDVYIASFSEELPPLDSPLPKALLRAIKKMPPEKSQKELFAWTLLGHAVSKSLAYEPKNWKLKRTKSGFVSGIFRFSICTTDTAALVAVSQEPVGLFAKEIPAGEKELFCREVEERAREVYRQSSLKENALSLCGIYEGTPPLYLALCGDSARVALIWRYEAKMGRSLQKLVPAQKAISL